MSATAGGLHCAANPEPASCRAVTLPPGGQAADKGYVAHEWGTFTSVQGADGVLLSWRPLVTTDLPRFVYDRTRADPSPVARSLLSKSEYIALQRMETPVIYFYADQELTVEAEVQFPKGVITEWYPQAAPISAADQAMTAGQRLRWTDVRVLPNARHQTLLANLPTDGSQNHYFAARETDSAFVQVEAKANPCGARETEKYLFYRGIGSFSTPLRLGMEADERHLVLTNEGNEPLSNLFVVQFRNGQGSFHSLARLEVGESTRVSLGPESTVLPSQPFAAALGRALVQALVAEGLFQREAQAMVATWRESWFGEEGLRVLYLLPRAWTDELLPLHLTPPPKSLVRVMVGRAELITPGMEEELKRQIARFATGDEKSKEQAATATREIGLGRFLEAAVRRLVKVNPDRPFVAHAWALFEAACKPAAAPPSLATR